MTRTASAKIEHFAATLRAEFPGATVEIQDGPYEKGMLAGPLTRTYVIDDGGPTKRVTVRHPFFADAEESPIGDLVAETARNAAADIRMGTDHVVIDRQGVTVLRGPFG